MRMPTRTRSKTAAAPGRARRSMRMRRRVSTPIGVDIGTSELRAVSLASSSPGPDGKVVVNAVAAHTFTDGAVNEGRIHSPLSVGAALDDVLAQLRAARGCPLVVTVGGKQSGLAVLAVSSAFRPDEWEPAIRNGLGQLSPSLAVDDAALSIVPIEHTREHTVVAVAGVHRDHLAAVRRAVGNTSATLTVVEPAAAALARAYVHTADDDVHAVLVNVGATTTTVVGRHGPNLTYIETLASGVNEIVGRLTSDFGLPVSDANQLIRQLVATDRAFAPTVTVDLDGDGLAQPDDTGPATSDLGNNLQDRFGQNFTDAVDVVVEHIASAIESAVDDPDRPNIDQPVGVSLTGRGALIDGFCRRAETRLGIPCHGALPWASIAVNDDTVAWMRHRPGAPDDLYVPSETYHRFGTAIGAAMTPLL